jgi:hypothetical protein
MMIIYSMDSATSTVLECLIILSQFGCVTIDRVWIGEWSIGHLYTPLGTTSNYSTTANLHTLQITAVNTKSPPACRVFNSCSLATMEILQLPAFRSFLSSEYPTTELSQFPSARLGSSL